MARARLTKKIVENVAPGPTTSIVWDTAVAGFGLKVSPKGKRIYFMKYRTKLGRQRKPNIGVHGAITCEQARTISQSWAFLIAAGRDPMSERDAVLSSPTIEEFCRRVVEDDCRPRLKRRSVEECQRLIDNVIVPKIGNLRVAEMTRAIVARLHQQLSATKPQANRTLSFLSKMFNLAERWGLRPDGTNPCRHIPHYPEKAKERFLTDAEIARLFDTLAIPEFASSPFATFIKLALMTGRRKSELLNLRWSDLDLDIGIMKLRDSKVGPRTFVLNDVAIETLRSIPRLEGQIYVIAGRKTDAPAVGVQKWWERVRSRAELSDVTIHTFRHAHASLGASLGQSLHQIGELLGHASAATTKKYAHLHDAANRQASNAIGRKLQAATTRQRLDNHAANSHVTSPPPISLVPEPDG